MADTTYPYLIVRNQAQQQLVIITELGRRQKYETGTVPGATMRALTFLYAAIDTLTRRGQALTSHQLEEIQNEIDGLLGYDILPFKDLNEAYANTRVDRDGRVMLGLHTHSISEVDGLSTLLETLSPIKAWDSGEIKKGTVVATPIGGWYKAKVDIANSTAYPVNTTPEWEEVLKGTYTNAEIDLLLKGVADDVPFILKDTLADRNSIPLAQRVTNLHVAVQEGSKNIVLVNGVEKYVPRTFVLKPLVNADGTLDYMGTGDQSDVWLEVPYTDPTKYLALTNTTAKTVDMGGQNLTIKSAETSRILGAAGFYDTSNYYKNTATDERKGRGDTQSWGKSDSTNGDGYGWENLLTAAVYISDLETGARKRDMVAIAGVEAIDTKYPMFRARLYDYNVATNITQDVYYELRLDGLYRDNIKILGTGAAGEYFTEDKVRATKLTNYVKQGTGRALTVDDNLLMALGILEYKFDILDASKLTTGTVADARLSTNVALKNINNLFSAIQTFSANILTNAISNITSTNNSQIQLNTTGTEVRTSVSGNIALKIINTISNATGRLTEWVKGTTVVASMSIDGLLDITGITKAGSTKFVEITNVVDAHLLNGGDIPPTELTKLQTFGNWTDGEYSGTPLINCNQGVSVKISIDNAGTITKYRVSFDEDNVPTRTLRG